MKKSMFTRGFNVFLTVLLAVAMPASFSSITASALSGGNIIDVGDSTTPSGDGWTYAGGVFTVTGDVTITGTTTQNRIVVAPGADVNIKLSDANIDIGRPGLSRLCGFDMAGATVKLTISGGNTVRSGIDRAGLRVPKGATLTIGGGHTDSLTAVGGSYGAGIGGDAVGGISDPDSGENGGNITITGGTVTAIGGNGSGIGGGGGTFGSGGHGGDVTITGGWVTAKGGGGAGIGGGAGYTDCGPTGIDGGDGGNITINGGTVTATSRRGAGLGGGATGFWEEIEGVGTAAGVETSSLTVAQSRP